MSDTRSTIKETFNNQTQLTDKELDYIYEQNLFKLFIPKEYGGEAYPLPRALEHIFNAGKRDGSLGWCVNLGAGAGYFSGFFDSQAANDIFGSPKSVIAGSGTNSGTATYKNNQFIINGEWSKCTGSAHATFFTVNALYENNTVKSFAVPRQSVEIVPSWELFALKKTSSDGIRISNAIIPEMYSFEMGVIKNKHAYAIHHLDFMPFARYCMAAAFYGMAKCFAHSVETFSNLGKDLITLISDGQHDLMERATRTWKHLDDGASIKHVDGLQESIGKNCRQIFNKTNNIFYAHGMRLSDENHYAHYAYRDVLLGSQHFLLK